MKLEEIKSICFIFENCESMTFPKEAIKKLEISNTNDEYCDLEAIVKLTDDVQLGLFKEKDSNPMKRIGDYVDITQIKIVYEDGSVKQHYVRWDYTNEYRNDYQVSEFIKWNEVKISINKDNKTYSIGEILNGDFKNGTKFKDEENKEYELYYDEDEDNMYLFNEYVNYKLLHKTFREV